MRAPVFGSGDVCLGWRCQPGHQEPGPPPPRPVPPELEELDAGWLAAQRRESKRLSRPFAIGVVAGAALAGLTIWLGTDGWISGALAVTAAAAFAVLAVASARTVWLGRRQLRRTVDAEMSRVVTVRSAQASDHVMAQEEHARWYRAWQEHDQAFARRPQWQPVVLPPEIDRVDVVGGTMAGWDALLTTVALPRLTAGGELTIIDLSEGVVAKDVVSLAGHAGVQPLVWLLPADLGRFDLGVGLPADALADVLAASASATAGDSDRDGAARDHALLQRVCGVLGEEVRIAQVTAGLRVLGQVGDPRDDVSRGLLTSGQLERLTRYFGRGAAERVVIERAWTLEARLRMLEELGCEPAGVPYSRLRVVATDRGAGAFGNSVLGTYVVVSLTHLLRQAPPGRPWRHTICLAGAEQLPGDVLDRFAVACESTRTGLVMAYRNVPAHVRERLGRGNAALAVMRLGNAEDAKAVSDQIGSEHRFVVSQLTDTVGTSVTDTVGDSYTSTVGTASSWSGSGSSSHTSGQSRGRGHSRGDVAPFGSRTGSHSRDSSESSGVTWSESITDGINNSTSWGLTTSKAVGVSDSLARTSARSREFLVEPYELQRLPPSAVIVAYASPQGRQVVMADANPAILTLSTAAPSITAPSTAAESTAGPSTAAPSTARLTRRPEEPPPNLGPPPEPLDWRRARRRQP